MAFHELVALTHGGEVRGFGRTFEEGHERRTLAPEQGEGDGAVALYL